MNNNENFNRYNSSLHHGSDLFFPQFMGLEHEEFAFTSYYSSMQNNSMSNNNQNLYRPYDIESTQSSKISEVTNGVGVVHSAGSLGNRNVLGNSSYAFADFNEKTFAWPHFPDTSYSHHSHFDNANYWPQLFQHNNNISEPNVHNLRHPLPPADPLLFCLERIEDDSSGSMYDIDVERSLSTSPEVIQATPITSTFSSDLILSQQNYQQPFASVSNDRLQQHPLPIRPIPQQASVVHPTLQNYPFMCPECGRYCSSSGGLKRHLRFCNVVRAKLKDKNANQHVERTGESESSFHYPYHAVDSGPLNLSTDNKNARATLQTEADGISIQSEPMNFSTNSLFAGGPSLSEENNNVIPSQSISANPTVSETALPTVAPIPVVQDHLELSFMSDFVVRARDRKCTQCPVILHSEKALVEHLLSHNIRQPYECKTCGSRFSRKFHMTRHMKQRGCDGTPRSQFNCEFCGKHYSRKDNMREHVKSHMGQTKKSGKLSCPVPRCEKTFSGKTQLQAHLNAHSDLRPYNCSLVDCEKTFRSHAALKRHVLIHSQGNTFQCPQCDKRFGAKHSLNRHIKSHDGKTSTKSNESQHCEVPFTQQKLLDEPIKVHLSNESFECDICYRTYKRHWRLKKHCRQMHHVNLADESNSIVVAVLDSTLDNVEENQPTYPHACDRCPKKFDKRQALKAHYVTHIQETSLMCTKCSRVFIRRDCLLRHLRTKHRLSSEESLQTMKKMNPRIFQDDTVASLTDVSLVDLSARSASNEIANEAQDAASSGLFGEIDVSILESHIIELLSLVVDSGVLRSFGWPNNSVDTILQSVLVKCGKEPMTQPDISLVQRLRGNTKILFSFLVDDQIAMENLFNRRPIEQVLQQVIELARGSTNNIVQLPL